MLRAPLPLVLPALLLGLSACSSRYESALLRLSYEPPSGVKLVGERVGPPAVARFSSGLELYSVPSGPLDLEEARLETTLQEALAAAGTTVPGKLTSRRAGSIQTGPVARFELKDGTSRTLIYLIPLQGRFLLVRLTAGEADYGTLGAAVERSLSSLRPQP